MRILVFILVLSLVAAPLAFAGDSTQVKAKVEEKKAEAKEDTGEKEKGEKAEKAKKMEWVTTESGLKYVDLVVGTGKEAANGDSVECHYTLWVADENDGPGQKIQSSKDINRTFSFKVGSRNLIKGWNEGMVGMKEGGTRRLLVPPKLGYGNRPPQQGKNMIFEIEYVKAL